MSSVLQHSQKAIREAQANFVKVKKWPLPPHLWAQFLPPDLKDLKEAWKVGAQFLLLRGERTVIHSLNPLESIPPHNL